MNQTPRKPLLLIALSLLLPFILAGCQATMQRIADCKVGDWNSIGHKDGIAGETQNYAERKDFCDDHGDDKKPAGADAASRYSAGWTQGNWDFWAALGERDGHQGQTSRYDAQAAKASADKKKTPLNRPAYDAGWLAGNSAWWRDAGLRDGTAGKPLAQKDASRAGADAAGLRFDEAAYAGGWQAGNRTFWQDAGYTDARNGTPDSELQRRASAARAAGVQVQEEVYRAAWNGEIVNYWRNLGTQDAVSGVDFKQRSSEARQKGLRVFETEYRQAWEKRLNDYWRQAGLDDGYGRPFQLEERIANAGRNGVFVLPGTRALYTAAWDEQNAKYCVPDNAFELGRRNAGVAADVCRVELRGQMKRAYLSGQDYQAASARRDQALADADDLGRRVRDARQRLGRLEKEIRAALDQKDRPVNEETAKQDKRREQERRELAEYLQRTERQLDEARRSADRHQQQMERLRRDIYLN